MIGPQNKKLWSKIITLFANKKVKYAIKSIPNSFYNVFCCQNKSKRLNEDLSGAP